MLLLDFITRQYDRHLSNIAIKVNREGEIFYPLYDNGRSLFYEDTEEMVKAACENVELYAAVSAITFELNDDTKTSLSCTKPNLLFKLK